MTIPDFSVLGLADWASLDFECDCGKRHSVGIEQIDISGKAAESMAELALGILKRTGMKLLAVGDKNTLKVAESALGVLKEKLAAFGASDALRILELAAGKGTHDLVPDEAAVGRILIESEGAAFILAIGSGSVNDSCRLVSARTGIPYAVFATAPSMDGYASTVSPLIVGGKKITYEAVYPRGIFADPAILAAAPAEMLRAGFGDILGKYTALADWRLARELKGEYHCPRMEALVEKAIERCVSPVREGKGIDPVATTEALVLSGLVMGMVGNSRPASGAEHHTAHYWETTALAAGRVHPLHGNSVGAATLVIAELYRMLADKISAGVRPPDPDTIRSLLGGAGYGQGDTGAHGATDAFDISEGEALGPAGLGISRDVFREGVLHAMEIRERFTILRLAEAEGRLADAAEALTIRFYDK